MYGDDTSWSVGLPAGATLYRVLKARREPLQPPPWGRADPYGGTFGNRFDDPGKHFGIPESERFRMIYCAMADLRVPADPPPGLADIPDDEPEPERVPAVPQGWLQRRRIVGILTGEPLRFANVASEEGLRKMRPFLEDESRYLGYRDFDLGGVFGGGRRLTQLMARFAYERSCDDGSPAFHGVRYVSRLNPRWECWALFDTRLGYSPTGPGSLGPGDAPPISASEPQTIGTDNPGLLEAALYHGLSVAHSV